MKFFTTVIFALVAVASVHAQDKPEAATQSFCEISTKGFAKNAKKVIELKCELEQVQLRRDIREANKPKQDVSTERIGVAAENQAVTTVTYRAADGTAFEGSKGWAKHEEKMAKIASDASRPSNPCGSWILAPSYCYGYPVVVGSPIYYSGVGVATPYGSYGNGTAAVYSGGRVSGGGRVYGGGYTTGKR